MKEQLLETSRTGGREDVERQEKLRYHRPEMVYLGCVHQITRGTGGGTFDMLIGGSGGFDDQAFS